MLLFSICFVVVFDLLLYTEYFWCYDTSKIIKIHFIRNTTCCKCFKLYEYRTQDDNVVRCNGSKRFLCQQIACIKCVVIKTEKGIKTFVCDGCEYLQKNPSKIFIEATHSKLISSRNQIKNAFNSPTGRKQFHKYNIPTPPKLLQIPADIRKLEKSSVAANAYLPFATVPEVFEIDNAENSSSGSIVFYLF